MAPIVAVGTMAFDTIETPFGKKDQTLGGSVNYFSLSACHFVPVQCVSVVGEDYPKDHLELLKSKGIDTAGIRIQRGKTFHWSGRYGYDLHEAATLDTQLNVFSGFDPDLPSSFRKAEYVFLGNLTPDIQLKVLDQVEKPKFIGLDTMNFWIEGHKERLLEAISKCQVVLINEAEIRLLTKKHNLVEAANIVRKWGPQVLVVKRGEYGAVLFDHGDAFSLPGLPLSDVADPTGAGDSFAGGFMGFIASQADFSTSRQALRKAVVFGSVMASFTCQDFSFSELVKLEKPLIEERYARFEELTRFNW